MGLHHVEDHLPLGPPFLGGRTPAAGWAFTMRTIPPNVTSPCRHCGRPGRAWLESDDHAGPVPVCASHAREAALELVDRVRRLVVV